MSAREYAFGLIGTRSTAAVVGLAALAIAACGSSGEGQPAAPTMTSPAMGTQPPTATAGRGTTPSTPAAATPPATGGGAAGMSASGGAAGMSASGGAAGMSASAGAGSAGMSAPAGGAGGAAGMAMGTLGGPLMYTDELTKGMTIPPEHKCPRSLVGMGGMGDNKSPPLAWTGGPAETKSFAVILFDTRYNVFHWGLWDIPPTLNKLPEGIAAGYDVQDPAGAHQFSAANSMDMHAYFGPCSDAGASAGTYEFRLFALNKEKLDLTEMSNAMMIQSAVDGAMLAEVVWEGTPE